MWCFFWKVIKPFNDICNDICIVRDNNIITKEEDLTDIFNKHYINIVENCTGVKPNALNDYKEVNDSEILSSIISKYKDHPSIIEINKNNVWEEEKFCLFEIDENETKKLLRNLNLNKSTGNDQIPHKLIKLAQTFLVKPLTNAINSSIRSSTFPAKAKYAAVTPLDKGGPNKTELTNYRPVSVLNAFSKFMNMLSKVS